MMRMVQLMQWITDNSARVVCDRYVAIFKSVSSGRFSKPDRLMRCRLVAEVVEDIA